MPVTLPSPQEILLRVRDDTERAARRTRNGVKHLAGVGRPAVGTAPKDVLWESGRATLWRYRSDRVQFTPPVLIVNSLLGRSSLLDLTENASLVRSFVASGLDVFMLDWGVPDERDAGNTLETYLDDYLAPAVERVTLAAGVPEVSLFGYCLGGVLAALLVASHPELPVRSLTALATPTDARHMGLLYDLLAEGKLEPDLLIDETGNVPPEVVRRAFRLLKPTADVTKYVTLWENLWNDEYVESYQAMGQWLQEHLPFPGATFRQLVDMLIRDNAMMNDTLRLHGRPVHLRSITCPFLNVVAERDHIVPPAAATPLLDLVGSTTKEELRLQAAHVGLVAGRTANKVTLPTMIEFLQRRSDRLGGGPLP